MATNIIVKNEFPLLPLFEKFIQDSKTGKRLQSNGKKISEGTITNYECVYKVLVPLVSIA